MSADVAPFDMRGVDLGHISRWPGGSIVMRLVSEAQPSYPSEWAGDRVSGGQAGASAETVRKWVRQAQIDGGQRPGLSTEESAEIKRLRREVAELRRVGAL